jgi:hypothetical protein
MKLQKIGGVASVANAVVSAIFLVILVVVFPRLGLIGPNDWMDPAKNISAWAASPVAFFSLDIEYILFGIASLLTMLALRERMQADAPILTQTALIVISIACALWLAAGLVDHTMRLAIISAGGDASAFRAAMAVFFGLSDGGDHASGWALLLIGWAALKTAKLPRMLGYLIVLAGLILIFDFLSMVLSIVALALWIILFLWLGIVLLRTES